MILLSIWFWRCFGFQQTVPDWYTFRKRANGIDVSSFEVECIGVKIPKDKILKQEVAIMKSYMGNAREFIELMNQTITYEVPTK